MFADIPDDEAQYWTSKLEWINTMSVDEEVKPKIGLSGSFRPVLRSPLLHPLLQYPLPEQSRQLPFAASQCCEYLLIPLPTARWSPLSSSRTWSCYVLFYSCPLFAFGSLCLTLMSALSPGNYFGWADPQSM